MLCTRFRRAEADICVWAKSSSQEFRQAPVSSFAKHFHLKCSKRFALLARLSIDMKALRRIHTYLGCFFAPLLLFFILSGWYQTVTPNRQKGTGEPGDWKARLTAVHVDSIYPSEPANSYSPALFRVLVVVMAVALVVTLVLGVAMAVRFT